MPDHFDEMLRKQVGGDYATFYAGRNGVYYILLYLKKRGAHRIHLSTYFKNAGQSVPMVSEKAGYKIIWNNGIPDMKEVQENDIILVIDNKIKIPKSRNVFTIQDSASNLQAPSKEFDFVLYSFNQDKPMSAAGGGVIVVNNEQYKDFLSIKRELKRLSGSDERKAYLNSIKWKIRSYKFVRRLGQWYLVMTKGKEGAVKDAIWSPEGKFHHIEYDMPRISRRLACDHMPISGN